MPNDEKLSSTEAQAELRDVPKTLLVFEYGLLHLSDIDVHITTSFDII